MRPPGSSSGSSSRSSSFLSLLSLSALLLLNIDPTAASSSSSSRPPSKDAILLSDVRALTLRAGRQTTSRRAPAIPQLRCASAPREICDRFAAEAVGGVLRCENAGSGAWGPEDVQWSCTAPSMPAEFRLGATDVQCEGYRSPEDDWVLRGSCGVEYRLLLTEAGERRYPELARTGGGWFGEGGGQPDYAARAFAVVFVAVAIWILYSAFCAAAANNRRAAPQNRPPRGGGGGGGGGGFWPGGGGGGGGYHDDDIDDPPPPYPGSGSGSRPKYSYASRQQQQQQQRQGAGGGWRPGFWSGLAGGAAAGYAAGNMGGRRRDNERGGGGGGGWGSSGSSRFSSPSSSGSSSGSPARYESTGFGSTSRR